MTDNKLAELARRVSSVESSSVTIVDRLSNLEMKVEALSPCPQPDPSVKLVTTVGEAVGAELRRKKNVIVTGLPQLTDKNDGDAVREFCEDHLGIKPWFDDKVSPNW